MDRHYWYVLVITERGPAFITGINAADSVAFWKRSGLPYEMSDQTVAEELADNLTRNGNPALAVSSTHKIRNQFYSYDMGSFQN